MDGIYDNSKTAEQNIAGLIRSEHGGMCSGSVTGVRFPGVPSVEEVAAKAGLIAADLGQPMTESQWQAAAEVVCPD